MRVVVLGRSPLLVRGLVAVLGERGVEVAAVVRSVSQVSSVLTGVDAVVAGVVSTSEEVTARLRALVSVLAEHPETALLVLGPVPRSVVAGGLRWESLPLDSADTDDVIAALGRLTSTVQRRRAVRPLLTTGEQRVLTLLAAGLSNDGIATHLGVSPKTVETHVSNAFGKLGLGTLDHSRNRRVVAALRWSGG